MTSASLRFENRLEGTSNFLPWKVGVAFLLEENDLWDIVKRCCGYTYRSTTVGSLQEEGSEGQVGDLGCCKGSFDSSHIQEEKDEGDV